MKNQLKAIAERIEDWKITRGISNSELCRRFTGLGSDKTFNSIKKGECEELNVERWLLQYDQVWNLIELESASDALDEPTYDDLLHVSKIRLAVEDCLFEPGNNRLVIVEGPSGSGKTVAGHKLAERFGTKIVLTEADETWKDSLSNMLGGLLRSLGAKTPPNGSENRKILLLEKLRETPVCLVIDEAHHLGPRTLNLVKTILNQTSCKVVFLAIPTLLRRLESTAFEEARQLTKNRLCERVRLASCDVASVEKFITRRLAMKKDDVRPCAKLLAERSGQYGNWNFVNLVCRAARQLAGKNGVDADTFSEALHKAAATR